MSTNFASGSMAASLWDVEAELLHEFFEAAVARDGTRIAVSCEDRDYTYAKVEERSNQLARLLLQSGASPGDRIGICLPRSLETYLSILAVLKAGCCYVPLSVEFPRDRLRFIAEDAELSVILTTTQTGIAEFELPTSTLVLDACNSQLRRLPTTRPATERLVHERDLCYIIYTSGTTDRPKGVAVEHRSICNFIRVAQEAYQFQREDRIYQGMTIAFDFSIEETWIPLAVGAAIVPGPTDSRRFGNELAEFLLGNDVTILCCVPTLLATMERQVPSLRQILVGGEACPADLVSTWSRDDLRLLNTYGPTETTVTASWCELVPDRPVTIGRPLPSYSMAILDAQNVPVPAGKTGEIAIGGVGVARGYINRDDLTATQFIEDTIGWTGEQGGRIYRTGDLGCVDELGEIVFLGRVDSQVKLRGYRIELEEIEAVLRSDPDILHSAVFVHRHNGMEVLAACVMLAPDADDLPLDRINWTLGERLPGYMRPAFLDIVAELPVLPSGKLDRKRLPKPKQRLVPSSGKTDPPVTAAEKAVHLAFELTLQGEVVSIHDDFFTDLAGDSLSAAGLISELRKEAIFCHASMGDLYAAPTVSQLAELLDRNRDFADAELEQGFDSPEKRVATDRQVWTCGTGQLVFVLAYIAVLGTPALVWLRYWYLGRESLAVHGMLLVFLGVLVIADISALVLPLILKWLILGKVKPGRHRLWGMYYFRWWSVNRAISFAPLATLKGTPLLVWYLRCLGSQIGERSCLESPLVTAFDLLKIGADSSIGPGTHIFGSRVINGWLELGAVDVGDGCYVGANSVLMPGSSMGSESSLVDQSLLATGQSIPVGTTWTGSPAKPLGAEMPEVRQLRSQKHTCSQKQRICSGIGFALLTMAVWCVPGVAGLPSFYVLAAGYAWYGWMGCLVVVPIAGVCYVLSLSGVVAVLKAVVLPTVKPGLHRQHTVFHLRHWFVDQLMAMHIVLVDAMYSTLYLPPFLRCLGVRMGHRAEVSTISGITPNLLTIGDESFVADAAHVGPARHFNGSILLGATEIGRRTFVGNAAFVPGATKLADESLIGVLSIPPSGAMPSGTSWLGSPAIFLPRRQDSGDFPESATFNPTRARIFERLAFEAVRATLPATLISLSLSVAFMVTTWALANLPMWAVTLAIPGLWMAIGVGLVSFVLAAKWLLIGSYQPLVRPLWSNFVRRTEFVTALFENLVAPFMSPLLGTPFAPWVIRPFGARIGKRCYLETTYLTEFDLVRVGDDCAIGPKCSLQTHLFEDRVMKMSSIRIGDGVSIGARAVVLYDSELQDNVLLDAMSLAMKGESLTERRAYRGSPAVATPIVISTKSNAGGD